MGFWIVDGEGENAGGNHAFFAGVVEAEMLTEELDEPGGAFDEGAVRGAIGVIILNGEMAEYPNVANGEANAFIVDLL